MKRATGLTQLVKILTRDTASLEWCLTKKPKLFASPTQIPKLGRSDHYTVLIKPETIVHQRAPLKQHLYTRDLRPSRINEFGRWITQYEWSEVLNLNNVQDKYDLFSSIITDAVNRYFPLKGVRSCTSDKPWITPKLKGLIEKRQKALTVHGKDSQVYKHWRAKVQYECKICKRIYYNNKVAALKDTNVQRWWKEVKGIAERKDSHDCFYQMLNDTITSLAVLGQLFNTFLANLTAHFTPLGTSPTTSVLDVPREFLVDTRKTFRALSQVKLNKSPRPNVVPNKIWKEFAWELAPVLSDIYNTSLRQGVVPSQLKESQVTPCLKCTPPKIIKNDLRPITLTCQVAKLMEGFTLDSVYNQIIDQLDDKQFSLPGKSCSHAIVYLLYHILASLDKGDCFVRILFTDFSKGFDLVDHNVLIREMRYLGVHEVLVRWVGSFLTARSQRVSG